MISKKHREDSSLRTTQEITSGYGVMGLKQYEEGKFRSKYEHAFAVYLNELGIKWEFEKSGEPITNISGVKLHYIPDFYLPEYRLYVEIVNNMSKRLARKMYAYKQKAKIELIVFDKQHLRDMFDSKFTLHDIIGRKKRRSE